GDFDLAGFAVGVVEAEAIVDGRERVHPGDVLIGLPSSGLHANGFSLVRAILARHGASLDEMLDGETLGDHLLKPTRVYCAPVRELLAKVPVHGMAHITGGGLTENVPRFLPQGCGVRIDADAWQRPALFDWLAEAGNVDPLEMLRTFNCGIGFVVAVPADRAEDALACLRGAGEAPVVIGAVEESNEQSVRYSA
ncbi:MAG: phosphoribosylformylglycinamidine cyclo-ligase, partial [Algiphilus sp.]